MDRRSFISNLTISTTSLGFACTTLGRRAELAINGDSRILTATGYGELVPVPAKNTGELLLALPRGFEYHVIGAVRSQMADGRPTPPFHDGMATFKVGRELRLVRNHEVSGGRIPRPGSAIGSGNHYDDTAGGGTTTLIVDRRTRQLVRSFVSLSGTLVNCSGGPTLWGSWISCEETTIGQTVRTDSHGVKIGGFPKPHGYCFEVFASANTNLPPVPLKAMGRFEHEAVAVDRKTGIIYLTEDFNPCGFYRFLPQRNKRLAEGGLLQMLAITGRDQYDTRTAQKQNVAHDVRWVTIDQPDPERADVDPLAVSKQGTARGGAMFARLEGCCTDSEGRVYFTSTSGGDNRGGQIWRYDPISRDEGKLTMLFESPGRDILDMPDNVCLRGNDRLLFICEDSDYAGASGTPENCIRILTSEGRMANFAVNVSPAFPRAEFAGVTFSPDGKTLFFNLQQLGVTLAVWGDWDSFRS